MSKLNVMAMALLLALLGGCANMSGTMVGTSAVRNSTVDAGAIAGEIWTNDD